MMMTENSTQRTRNPSVLVLLFIQLSSIIRTLVLSHRSLLPALTLVSLGAHTLFSDALLIPPLYIYSAIMGPQLVFFSHHPRTDIPGSQHSSMKMRKDQFSIHPIWYTIEVLVSF